jgi:hypothetical protein
LNGVTAQLGKATKQYLGEESDDEA